MGLVKISELSNLASPAGTDIVPIVQGAATYKVTAANLLAVSHTHTLSQITDAGTAAGYASTAFAAASHTHAATDITSGTLNVARVPTGTTGSTVCIGNDSRLSDSRTPTTHAASHKSGGSDSIKLDELAAPTDVTTLDVSTSTHGLTPKAPNDTTKFLRGDATWAGTGWDIIQVLAADFAVTNASNQDTGLQFTTTTGEFWHVQLYGVASGTNSTCDAAVQLANTGTWTTATSHAWGVHYNTSGTLTDRPPAAASNAAYYFSGGTGLGVCNSSTKSPFELHFNFDIATGGDVKVQFGNASAGASWTSTLYKGAVLLARKIRTT